VLIRIKSLKLSKDANIVGDTKSAFM